MDLLQRARELYAAGRPHDALEAAQAACDRAPKDPEAWALLGRVSRHAGLPAASDDAFLRASRLSPRHRPPHRVSAARFREIVAEAQVELTRDGRPGPTEKNLRVEPLPAVEDVRQGLDPDALTAGGRTAAEPLILFQCNHENRSSDDRALRTLVRRSLSQG
ncbi:MAG: tetratricopeptide repeat protein [Candidatus Dormibacteraeota bacterium]|nr:tetratricopeptide repeat protein [Candidatus Dormibacteraeota bacterium]